MRFFSDAEFQWQWGRTSKIFFNEIVKKKKQIV